MTGKSKKRKETNIDKKKSSLDAFKDMDDHIDQWQKSMEPSQDSQGGIKEQESSASIYEELLNISASINSTFNQPELLKKIIDAVIRITGCDRGFLLLRDEKGEDSFAIARSRDKKELGEEAFKVSRTVIEEAEKTGEPVVCDDIQKSDTFKYQKSIRDLNLKSAYCVPLKYEDKLVGIIYVDRDRFSQHAPMVDCSVLKAFGAQAAVAIENARRQGELEHSVQNLKKQLAGRYEFSGIIGQSKALLEVIDNIKKVAPLSSTVFLQGESGTGKELVARAIHYNSPRKGKTFVAVNCGGIPEGVLESELFGHRRGAFTGAEMDRVGAFEEADGSTLFLDEIADMPRELQTKILRAIQEGEIKRIGENQPRKINVRIISATNKDLTREMEKGRFRDDLYYRLYVVPIYVPSLRERPEDILPLADFFLEMYARLEGLEKPSFTRDARELLLMFNWPGNVRQIQNVIQRTLALAGEGSTISARELKPALQKEGFEIASDGKVSLKQTLSNFEAEHIRKTLLLHSWNITKAAEVLGISRQVLHNKINKFGLSQDN